jgi:hypothetical protein
MAATLTTLTHKIAIQLHLVAELCQMQFSLQAASPETFGYTLVRFSREWRSANRTELKTDAGIKGGSQNGYTIYGVITNDVSDYMNLLVRIAHIICNHPLLRR